MIVVNFSVIHLSSWNFKIYPLWSSRCFYLCCFIDVPIFLLIICSITCTRKHNMYNMWTQWCTANVRIWFSFFILVLLCFTSDVMSQVVQCLLRHTSVFNEKVLAVFVCVIMSPYSAPSLMFHIFALKHNDNLYLFFALRATFSCLWTNCLWHRSDKHMGEYAFTHTVTDFSFCVFALQTVYAELIMSIH